MITLAHSGWEATNLHLEGMRDHIWEGNPGTVSEVLRQSNASVVLLCAQSQDLQSTCQNLFLSNNSNATFISTFPFLANALSLEPNHRLSVAMWSKAKGG